MSFTFDPNHMAQDMLALSKGAAPFLERGSPLLIERLIATLRNAVLNARRGGKTDFVWGTDADAPIQVRQSRGWKGGTNNFDPLAADIRLTYSCQDLAAEGRVRAHGVAVVVIRDVAGEEEKTVHFDVDQGGWSEIVEGQRLDRAGHPPFHAQFYGMVNDIPRTPSLIVHPVDVINFAIIELHQKQWRQHVTTFATKSKLRQFAPRQRQRLLAITEGWRTAIENPDYHPLVSLQRPFAAPLAL